MAAENDSEQDKYLTPDELENITVCASDLLVQNFRRMRALSSITLSTLVSKCGQSVKRKLAPFISNGIYGRLFDNKEDAIGVLDKPVAVYNLSGVKDNHNLARLVHREIFFVSFVC
ncbi:Type IV secretory pathway, VirB4 components [Escherichia coli]|nr:Type IV secretory pathway, VirB4 components [Escherichia coli]